VSIVIDSCHGLGLGHGSRVMWVTGHKMWPIVSSGWWSRLRRGRAQPVIQRYSGKNSCHDFWIEL